MSKIPFLYPAEYIVLSNVGEEESERKDQKQPLLPNPPVLWLPNGNPSKLMLRFAAASWWYLSPRFRKHMDVHCLARKTGDYVKVANDNGHLVLHDFYKGYITYRIIFLQPAEEIYGKKEDPVYISFRRIRGHSLGYALVSHTVYDIDNPQPVKTYSSAWFAELAGTPEETYLAHSSETSSTD